MPSIRVDVTGEHERVGRQMGADRLPIIHTAEDWLIDALDHGMQSGATSLMVMIPAKVEDLDVLVMAETSLQCWMMAATVLAAKFRDEVEQPGWARLSPAARAMLLPRYAEAVRRVIPTSAEEAGELAELLLDALSAGAPVEEPSDG